MTKQHEQLNQLVANLTVLYTKLHSFHWYVKGPHFYTLHKLFEKNYDFVTEVLDEVAERFLSVGGRPVSTLAGSLKIATIKEATETETTIEMIETIRADFKQLIAELTELMESSEEANDQGTADLALGIKTTLEKRVWMLDAHLS